MARFGYLKASLFSLACLLALAFTTNAQTPAPTPQVIAAQPPNRRNASPANQASIAPVTFAIKRLPHMPEIVGAEEEQEQRTYSQTAMSSI